MDVILTFVLIITSGSLARPMIAVPGYTSPEACEQAAKAVVEAYKKTAPGYNSAYVFCVPGPERRP